MKTVFLMQECVPISIQVRKTKTNYIYCSSGSCSHGTKFDLF